MTWRSRSKKMSVVTSMNFQKKVLVYVVICTQTNVRIKVQDIDRTKMDPKSILAVIKMIKSMHFMYLILLWVD